MQDLVGVRVADAAEEVRIGERALERVVLAAESLREGLQLAADDLDSARVQRVEAGGSAHDVDARALLRAGLGEDERAARILLRGREVETREADLAGHRRRRRLPLE